MYWGYEPQPTGFRLFMVRVGTAFAMIAWLCLILAGLLILGGFVALAF